jgi:hypothetical protein
VGNYENTFFILDGSGFGLESDGLWEFPRWLRFTHPDIATT